MSSLPNASDDFLIGSSLEVNIIYASSPWDFGCHAWSLRAYFEKFQMDLQAYYSIKENLIKIPGMYIRFGSLCACQHPDNKKWCRAEIKSYDPFIDAVTLHLVDFGDTILVSEKDIHPLPPLFRLLAQQIIFCKLAGVKPLDIVWTSEDCIRFKQLVEKKLCHIVVHSIELENCRKIFKVYLQFLAELGVGKDVGEILVEENRAIKKIE